MFAARFGLLFRCNPLDVLDASYEDIEFLEALYEAAARDVEQHGRP